MRMPFRRPEPTRMERVRCAVSDRASEAAHSLSGAAGTAAGAAQGAAVTAAGAAQQAAHVVADRTTLAAHEVSDRASAAASSMVEAARPVAAEAAVRTTAAWRVLRYGVPTRPGPMGRVTAILPVATVASVTRRSKAPLALMALGAAGAVVVLLVRRSRMDRESVWILDEDGDAESVGRWEQGEARGMTPDDAKGEASSERRDSPANRWP